MFTTNSVIQYCNNDFREVVVGFQNHIHTSTSHKIIDFVQQTDKICLCKIQLYTKLCPDSEWLVFNIRFEAIPMQYYTHSGELVDGYRYKVTVTQPDNPYVGAEFWGLSRSIYEDVLEYLNITKNT